jgi:hypothetical protein
MAKACGIRLVLMLRRSKRSRIRLETRFLETPENKVVEHSWNLLDDFQKY